MCFSRTSVIHNVVIVTLQFLIRRGRLLILQPLTPDFIWTPSPHLLFLKKMPSVYCLFGPCLFRTGQSTPERNKGRSELTKFYLHIFVFKINFLIIDAPSPHTSKILKKIVEFRVSRVLPVEGLEPLYRLSMFKRAK